MSTRAHAAVVGADPLIPLVIVSDGGVSDGRDTTSTDGKADGALNGDGLVFPRLHLGSSGRSVNLNYRLLKKLLVLTTKRPKDAPAEVCAQDPSEHFQL